MTSRDIPRMAALLFGYALCLKGGACGTILPPVVAPAPSASGTWTGRLISIPVRDLEGNEYVAAAMRIETGPRNLRPSYGESRVGNDDVPFLSFDGHTIVDPVDLGVAVCAHIRVSGKMSFSAVGIRVEHTPGKPKVFHGVRRVGDSPPGGNVVIRIHGKPRAAR